MFGAHFLLVFLLEWLTVLPETTCFLHISQNFAILMPFLTGKIKRKIFYHLKQCFASNN